MLLAETLYCSRLRLITFQEQWRSRLASEVAVRNVVVLEDALEGSDGGFDDLFDVVEDRADQRGVKHAAFGRFVEAQDLVDVSSRAAFLGLLLDNLLVHTYRRFFALACCTLTSKTSAGVNPAAISSLIPDKQVLKVTDHLSCKINDPRKLAIFQPEGSQMQGKTIDTIL